MLPLVNLNGNLVSKSSAFFGFDHAAVTNAEIIQEKIRLFKGQFLYAEKHYFHLMANMRMARMEIPVAFTPEHFYNQLNKLKSTLEVENAAFMFNVSATLHTTDFWITASVLPDSFYFNNQYEIDLFRETHVENGFINRIHFPYPQQRILRTFSAENDLQDVLLLNENKSIARSSKGDIFIIKDRSIITPTLENGAKDDVLRDMVIRSLKNAPHFDEVLEGVIFPFDLMKSDELFVAINGFGIYSVSKFRKKIFDVSTTGEIMQWIVQDQEL